MIPWIEFSTLRYGVNSVLRNVVALFFVAILPLHAVAEQTGKTIIAFGDSLTQGFGLPTADGFVPQLEAWLDQNGFDAKVINAGVSGDTTQGGASRIAWTLAEPADLIIVALGGNDALRGIAPSVVRANLEAILQTTQSYKVPVLLVGMSAPLNYGAAYKAEFDAIFPDLASDFDVPLYPVFFQALIGEGAILPDLQTYFQADAIHPNAAGVREIVLDIGPVIAKALGDD